MKVVRIIARLNVGGPARHCLLLGGALRSRGFEQVLATGELDDGEASALDREPALGAGSRLVQIPGLGRRIAPTDDARALVALVSLLRRERPLVVHTHTAKAGALGRVAAWLTRVPVVVHTFHGHVLSGYFGPTGNFLARTAERALARLAGKLVVLSEQQRDDLANRFHVAPPERFRIIPLGRDLASFAAAPKGQFRAELGLDAKTPLLAFVGRLVPIKDPVTLLQALALTKTRAVLAVCGSGPLEQTIRDKASALGLGDRVRLLGWRGDLASILADVDALVLSSKNEGTPLAIIEALASGCAVVSTAVGGVPDMLSPEGGAASPEACARARALGVDLRAEGALVPSENPEALARALDLVLGDDALRAAAGEAGRATAARYDVDRLADDVAKLYRELLEGSPRGRRELAPVALPVVRT